MSVVDFLKSFFKMHDGENGEADPEGEAVHAEVLDSTVEISKQRARRFEAEADLRHYTAAHLRDVGLPEKASLEEERAIDLARQRDEEERRLQSLMEHRDRAMRKRRIERGVLEAQMEAILGRANRHRRGNTGGSAPSR